MALYKVKLRLSYEAEVLTEATNAEEAERRAIREASHAVMSGVMGQFPEAPIAGHAEPCGVVCVTEFS